MLASIKQVLSEQTSEGAWIMYHFCHLHSTVQNMHKFN